MSVLTFPTKLKAGGTLRISFQTFDETQAPPVLANPGTGPFINIELRANGIITPYRTNAICVNDGTGLWHYDLQSVSSDVAGIYFVWFESTSSGETFTSPPIGAVQIVI